MTSYKQLILLVILFATSNSLLYSQEDLKTRIEALPGIISVEQIETDSEYSEAFKIFIEQPVDHNNPDGKKFKQKFYLSHKDESLPMVIELDGYSINYNQKERTCINVKVQ